MKPMQTPTSEYSSAEFQLSNPGIYYQFKLRQTDQEPMFGLIQKDSKALASLKPGDILEVTFHFPDRTIPAEKQSTLIKYIKDGSSFGFNNHCMVALDISNQS